MYDLNEFLRKNELKLGEGYDIKPSAKYALLREALKNFYETYQSGWGNGGKLGHFIIINDTHVQLRSANGPAYILNCYNSIIHLQMFLELYIVDMLEEIHPVLVKGKLNKELDLLNAITGNFDKINLTNKKTIPFSEVMNRLEFLITNAKDLPESLRIDIKYHFLREHISTIRAVLNLRNTMLHKGKGLLYDFALDVFWVNHVIPMICEILSMENDRMVFLDRNTYCGINVLQELNELIIDHDYEDITKQDYFNRTLNYVCHLKELGRASYTNKLFMKEWGDESFQQLYEKTNNQRKRKEAEDKAKVILKHLDYQHGIHQCPCCGTNSMLSFETWHMLDVNKLQLHKAECIQCTYAISMYIDEPKEYKIMEENVFVYVD